MSIIDDYAAIAKALREITEPPKVERPLPLPEPRNAVGPWQQGQQAARNQYTQKCLLCGSVGWIAIWRYGLWVGVNCPSCGNPTRRGCPTI